MAAREHEQKAAVEQPKGELPFDPEDVAEVIGGVIKESKAGFKTTEFWLAVAIALLTVLDGIPLPEQFEGYVVAGIGIAYTLSRGLAKKGIPAVEVEDAKRVRVKPSA